MTQCAAAPCREPRVLRRLGAFAEVAPPLRAPLGVVSRKPSCRDTVQPALGAVSPQRGEALYSAQEGTKTSADRDEKRVCVKARAAHVGHLWICRRHIWGEFTGKLHRFSAGLRLSSAASAESHKRARSTYKRAGGLRSTLRPCRVRMEQLRGSPSTTPDKRQTLLRRHVPRHV